MKRAENESREIDIKGGLFMKKVLIVCLVFALYVSAASAEMLMGIGNLGQGKFGVSGAVVSASNSISSMSNYMVYGGVLGYGIMQNLDLVGSIGSMQYNNLPSGLTASGPQVGATLKYNFTGSDPTNVSGILGYKSTNLAVKSGLLEYNAVTNDLSVGVLFGQMMNNVMPYTAALYHSYANASMGSSSSSNSTELVAGIKYIPAANYSVVLEYAANSLSSAVSQTVSTIGLTFGAVL